MPPLESKIMTYQVEWALFQKILIQKNLKQNFQHVLRGSFKRIAQTFCGVIRNSRNLTY